MLKDKFELTKGEAWGVQTFIEESANDIQQSSKYLPNTDDLPTTHEHYVRREQEVRNGQTLSILKVGVRLKAEKKPKVSTEPDELNTLDLPTLEVEAAKLGLEPTAFKRLNKAGRVKALRTAKAQHQPTPELVETAATGE